MVDVYEQNLKTLPRMPDGSPRYPRGWFMIGTAADYPVATALKKHFFSRDLVIWRDEQGNIAAFDAYCPHLGTHLGVNAEITGNYLKCPSHAAKFDTKGNCIDPPRGESPDLCSHLKAQSWPVAEVNGVVLIWHDPEGNAPDFNIDTLQEYGDEGWSDWYFKKMDLPVHPREIIENVADKAHFVYVHGFDQIQDFRNDFHLHMATQYMEGSSDRGSTLSISTYFGPGYQITWMDNTIFQSRLLNTHVPIDESHTELWFGVMIKKSEIDRQGITKLEPGLEVDQQWLQSLTDEQLLEAYAQTVHQGFDQDVGIWRRKLYRTEPVYCDGDGPLAKCRKWYNQFYVNAGKMVPRRQPEELRLNPYINYP